MPHGNDSSLVHEAAEGSKTKVPVTGEEMRKAEEKNDQSDEDEGDLYPLCVPLEKRQNPYCAAT